jgi:hypothetical protein
MVVAGATRREASGWHFEVVVHEHQVGSLEGRMLAVAECVWELEVEVGEEALPSCRPETSVVSSASAQRGSGSLVAFCPTVL